MTGPDFLWAMNEEEFGLLPRAVRHVFYLMKEVPEREYKVHVSYLEVQRDAVFDLLSTSNSQMQLNVLEDNMGNVVIPGLNVVDCSNITEVFNCLEAGLVLRHTAALQNRNPATSHAIFSIILEHQWTDTDGKLKYLYSRMSFVDLGSQERQITFGIPPSYCRDEANFLLNSDLTSLGNLIHCLADQNYHGQIPYRESRLTHILKDAFGGNSLTLIVCCVSPAASEFDATFNTLKYGTLARYIVNCPAPNIAIQNSARVSGSTPQSASTTYRQQSSSRVSTNTFNQSVLQHSIVTIPQSAPTVQQPQTTNENAVNTAEEGSVSLDNDDFFKLQFAASQWQILASSAEDLLSEMLACEQIPVTEKSRIQSWLCMKAEADDCIGSDLGFKDPNKPNRILEVIEELSEPEANVTRTSGSCSSSSTLTESSDEDESDMSFGEEFYDHLAELQEKFKTLTDELVQETEEQLDRCDDVKASRERCKSEATNNTLTNKNEYEPSVLSGKTSESKTSSDIQENSQRNSSGGMQRRVSSQNRRGSLVTIPRIDEVSQNVEWTTEDWSDSEGDRRDSSDQDVEMKDEDLEERKHSVSSVSSASSGPVFRVVRQMKSKVKNSKLVAELKQLSASKETRKGQVRRVSVELKAAQQRLKQLNATIRLKEAFIRELVRSGGEAEVTRKKCEKKMGRLEKEVNRAKQLYQEAQDQLKEIHKCGTPEVNDLRNKIDLYKKQISYYQRKLSTLEKVSAISQHADSKVSELEASVKEMRRQQEDLKIQLHEETHRKEALEQQIALDQRRIKELEAKMKQVQSDTDAARSSWLTEEEERVLQLRQATEQLQEQVKQREEAVKQRERMQKEKQRLVETSRATNQGQGCESDWEADLNQRLESDLREEISHLRTARDSLMVKRQKLDRRIHRARGRGVGSKEERRLLELDEAIEAVDAAIEYKNEVICGRAKELKTTAKLLSQDNLMERLMNLTAEEIRSLLVKYFNKVIDIRLEFRKQEISFSDIEKQYEEQSKYIHDLKAAYQQASLEMERRITSQQREYQQKIGTLLHQFNDDSSGSGPYEFRLREMERHLYYYKKLSRDLKTRLRQYMDENKEKISEPQPGPSTYPTVGAPVISSYTSAPIQQHHSFASHPPAPLLPRRTRLHAAAQARKQPPPQTKVTREGNKIVIRQKSDKQLKGKLGCDSR
ncbi:kinesin-like protein costa isoform X2 [Oratosquilla oratoria]